MSLSNILYFDYFTNYSQTNFINFSLTYYSNKFEEQFIIEMQILGKIFSPLLIDVNIIQIDVIS